MGDMADALIDSMDWQASDSMLEQIKIQEKIESYNQINEDVANGIKPF